LIYYAGHGEIDRELNDGYWVPANAKGGDATTYVDNTVVQKVMKGMKAKHVLLISDSCYSGTLFGEGRSLPPIIDDKFYLNLYNEKSRWGMTSGNKTPVSDSGSEGHSIFAYQLLKALKRNEKPYVTTQEIYSRIAPIIANNSEQQPLCLPVRNAGDQGGGFVFVASTFSTLSAMDSPSYLPKASPRVDKVFLDDQEEDVRLDEERRKLDKEKALLEKRKALDEKRRKVEEEKARHETEQQEAAEQRQLEAEQRRVEKERAALMKQKALEEKRRKVEEEKVRLAEEIEEAAAAAAKRAAKANKTTTLAMVKRPSQSTAGETGRDVYGQEKGTAKEAKDIVAKAIAYYKANGMDKTFAAINDPGGQFTKKDLYVFALDFNTVCLAHGANKALIGKNLTELKDSNGKQFLNVMTQGAKTKGKGWVDYNWINPTSKKIEAKSSYYQKEGDFYFGCGIYK
ncbi:MAG: cache domain-containing protein, partial [Syntrophus sp. (in: bacteria)]